MKSRIAVLMLLIAAVSTTAAANNVLLEGEAAPGALRWRRASIQIAVSSSFRNNVANIKSDSDISGAIRGSLEAWRAVADIDLQLTSSEKQNVSGSDAGDGVSLITIAATPENLLLFTKNSDSLSATTRVFYNKRGAITEADIVLNPYLQFSTDGTFGTFDLQSVLTHEIGHLLGLDHSPLAGATMHQSYGRNGLYGLQNFTSRSLSASDISAVRALYGPRSGTARCCGSIAGAAFFTNRSPARNALIWAEDASGRVLGAAEAGADGKFRFDGLSDGEYKLFAAPSTASKERFSVSMIGNTAVAGGETSVATKGLRLSPVPSELKFIGFNGQLSDVSIPLSSGQAYTIYVGGNNVEACSFFFSSPYLSVVPNTLQKLDYGDDVDVVSFQIYIDPDAPSAEYTVFAQDLASRKLTAIPGGISVGEIANPLQLTIPNRF